MSVPRIHPISDFLKGPELVFVHTVKFLRYACQKCGHPAQSGTPLLVDFAGLELCQSESNIRLYGQALIKGNSKKSDIEADEKLKTWSRPL